MKKLLLLLILFSTTAYAEDTYKLQVVTKDFVPEVGVQYQDAQYFDCVSTQTFDECVNAHKNEVKAEKDKRIANYVNAVKHPPVQDEPTKEELMDLKAQIEAQLSDLDAKIAVAKHKK